MAFRARKHADPRPGEWAAFAGEYDLTPAAEYAEALRAHLDLGPGDLDPVYQLTREGQPQLLVFDQKRQRSGPLGRVNNLRTGVVVRGRVPHSPFSLKANARRHAVLETLEAGRTGGRRLPTEFDAAFDAAVSVYARDVDQALPLLTDPVRTVLARLLRAAETAVADDEGRRAAVPRHASGAAPSVAIGPRNLFLSLEGREPVALGALSGMIADLLSLHVALVAANRRPPAG